MIQNKNRDATQDSAVRTGHGIVQALRATEQRARFPWSVAAASTAVGVLAALAAPVIWDRITTIIADMIV